ncbi:MAG: hypothetical protein KGL74_02105, partial [Elusimicrobia bacterium]|nr:hypothetical protein [Elusimicrobiota bacterium]
AHAVLLAGEVLLHLVEAGEHGAVRFGRDAGSQVGDRQGGAVVVGLDADGHDGRRRRVELEGVFHQVEKDFTGQMEGMGLGLPFVRKVAELHGGHATLRSKLGEGTTVTVTWPRRRPA